MKWYLAALVVVPAVFLLADLGIRRLDPWMARHRALLYSVCALMAVVMLAARGIVGVRSVGDWLILAGMACYAVFFVARAVRVRHAEKDQSEPAA